MMAFSLFFLPKLLWEQHVLVLHTSFHTILISSLRKSWDLSISWDFVDHVFIQHLLSSSPTVIRYNIE